MTDVHPPLPRSGDDPDDLSGRIVSRICHDLVSPLGAIANGVELLLLSGATPTAETALISESVATANARIRFFRIAFGTATSQAVGRSEILETLRGLEKGSRLSYDWAAEGDPPRGEVKTAFLLLLCLESAMPLGGRIRVARDGPDWVLRAEAARLRLLPELWDALGPARAAPPAAASQVQFALLPPTLEALERELRLEFGPDSIVARF